MDGSKAILGSGTSGRGRTDRPPAGFPRAPVDSLASVGAMRRDSGGEPDPGDETRGAAELVKRASGGDPHAVDALLQRHLPGLRTYVRRNIGPALLAKESSSDVVQSVCREVLADVGRFEYQGEAAFRAWLHQAALRKIIDRHRYYRAEKRDGAREVAPESASTLTSDELAVLATSIHTPSRDAMMNEEIERLERGFAKLAEADQRVIKLVYVEGLTHSQVAERLGCSEVNSRKMLSRALARLSKQI
jgi:RNA polymerase sigma-70 factor, ECF subfamily